MHTFEMVILYVLTTIGIGIVAGVIHAIYAYTRVRTVNLLNKAGGGRSFVILSGSPEAVKQAYDVCVAIISRIEESQTKTSQMRVGLADEQPTEPATDTAGSPEETPRP